jgi:hypothetical protein
MAAEITFLQDAGDSADQSTYTFSAQNLGAASSGRHIAVCIASRAVGTSSLAVSSVTIQGITASLSVSAQNVTSNVTVACIAIAAVPSGTTGDIVITLPRTALRIGIAVFSIANISGTTPSDTDSSTANAPTCSLDIPANGVALAISARAGSGSVTWSGLTERSDATIESNLNVSSASDAFATLQAGLSITATHSGVGDAIGAFASWGPAVGGGAIPVFINHYRQQGIM